MRASKENIFTKISSITFKNRAFSSIVLVGLIIFGGLSYTGLLRREGFPSVQSPIAVAAGQYFVNDANLVDQDVAAKLSPVIDDLDIVKDYVISSGENTFNIQANLIEGTDSGVGNEALRAAINDSDVLPEGADFETIDIDIAKFQAEYSVLLSVYADDNNKSLDELVAHANSILPKLAEQSLINKAVVVDPYTVNPADDSDRFQSVFTKVLDEDDRSFKDAVFIGLVAPQNTDIFKLDDQITPIINQSNSDSGEFTAVVTGSLVDSVSGDINSLQSNVISGALVVVAISALMISWRLSILTAVFMISVLLISTAVLLVIGASLNVITLFSLLLALGLFVDDATIIAESIYAQKDPKKKPLRVVKDAIESVGRASFAGTLTTILVFSPLLFITGILGSFIVQMPLTVIISLVVSFILSITLIPLLANYTMLGDNVKVSNRTAPVSNFLADRIEDLQKDTRRGVAWGVAMVVISLAMIAGSFSFFQKLDFDIFPNGKDSDAIVVSIDFNDGTTIEEAISITDEVGGIFLESAIDDNGESFVDTAAVGVQQIASDGSATIEATLTPFQSRDTTSIQISEKINQAFKNYTKAEINAEQISSGPPSEEFPFAMQITATNLEEAQKLAANTQDYLLNNNFGDDEGDPIKATEVRLDGMDRPVRYDGVRKLTVKAALNKDGTTGEIQKIQDAVLEEYDDEKLSTFGLSRDDIGFDRGQDSDFEDSFNSLPIAGLGALLIMIVLLAVQFRSIIKPFLILIALPFSLFGIAWGLFITDNALSFFSMVGIIGLIGIAVNNTILLVDNATHQQQEGLNPVKAIAQALRERFRPLVTTTFTTVAALVPLAMSDPFWESLAISIIFGLLSSTFLVVIAFPYYYLLPVAIGKGLRKLFNKS